MPTNANATISNDISYTMLDRVGGTQFNEVSSLDYSYSFTNGIDSGEIDYGVTITGSLGSGDSQVFDCSSLDKRVFAGSTTVAFESVKAIVVQNRSAFGKDLNIHATGVSALTELFNGGSGNLLIKPYAVYQYADPLGAIEVSSTGSKEFTIKDDSGTGVDWSMIIVGVTGVPVIE